MIQLNNCNSAQAGQSYDKFQSQALNQKDVSGLPEKSIGKIGITTVKKIQAANNKATSNKKMSMLKIGLVATSALLIIGGLFYALRHPSLAPNQPLPTPNMKLIQTAFNNECHKITLNHCTKDRSLCVKDYISETWEPYIHFEYEKDILCRIELVGKNPGDCSKMIYQPSYFGDDRSNAFRRNFETTKGSLESLYQSLNEADDATKSWVDDLLKRHKSSWNPSSGQFIFKQHVTCKDPS